MVKTESDGAGRRRRAHPAGPRPLGFSLRQAAAAHRLRMERALADVEITPPQFLIMTMLGIQEDQSGADIARRTSLTPPTISVIIANLERRGLLARHPHAIHGRMRRLSLTQEGLALLAACRERAAQVERELVAGLPASSAEIILQWLEKVSGET